MRIHFIKTGFHLHWRTLAIACSGMLLALASCHQHTSDAPAKPPESQTDHSQSHSDRQADHSNSHAESQTDLSQAAESSEKTEEEIYTLLRPTNSSVISAVPVISLQTSSQALSIEALGRVDYDTRRVRTISARVSGRIEKLYVKYRYQHVHSGDRIMEIYSPELVTAQQDLLFILHSDPENTALLDAARIKLELLGMNAEQLQQVIRSGKPFYKVTLYSGFTGQIHEGGNAAGNNGNDQPAGASASVAGLMDGSKGMGELPVKEGMYVQKGQTIFQVYNTDQSWIILNLYAGNASLIKTGSPLTITPETAPDRPFRATISYIEPFYRDNSKTLSARVYFDNSRRQLPIGSQVKATIQTRTATGSWLPLEAVLSLGLQSVVLKKENGSFRVNAVRTGIRTDSLLQILSGLSPQDSVAVNAQFLMDSESFIKTKN